MKEIKKPTKFCLCLFEVLTVSVFLHQFVLDSSSGYWQRLWIWNWTMKQQKCLINKKQSFHESSVCVKYFSARLCGRSVLSPLGSISEAPGLCFASLVFFSMPFWASHMYSTTFLLILSATLTWASMFYIPVGLNWFHSFHISIFYFWLHTFTVMIFEDDGSRVSINDIQEEVRRVVVGLAGISWETKIILCSTGKCVILHYWKIQSRTDAWEIVQRCLCWTVVNLSNTVMNQKEKSKILMTNRYWKNASSYNFKDHQNLIYSLSGS